MATPSESTLANALSQPGSQVLSVCQSNTVQLPGPGQGHDLLRISHEPDFFSMGTFSIATVILPLQIIHTSPSIGNLSFAPSPTTATGQEHPRTVDVAAERRSRARRPHSTSVAFVASSKILHYRFVCVVFDSNRTNLPARV